MSTVACLRKNGRLQATGRSSRTFRTWAKPVCHRASSCPTIRCRCNRFTSRMTWIRHWLHGWPYRGRGWALRPTTSSGCLPSRWSAASTIRSPARSPCRLKPRFRAISHHLILKIMNRIILSLLPLLLAGLASCNKWLDVQPETEVDRDILFSSAEGYEEALLGIYSRGTIDDLYGKELTIGTPEVLAQHYTISDQD